MGSTPHPDAHAKLSSLYGDLKTDRVKPIDDEAFFESLRRREAEPTAKRPRQ